MHGGFFEWETWILDNVDKIRHIPTSIVQVRKTTSFFAPFKNDRFHLYQDKLRTNVPVGKTQKGTTVHRPQGRYDVVCPAKSAWDLHRAFPEADLHIVNDSGTRIWVHTVDTQVVSVRAVPGASATTRFRCTMRLPLIGKSRPILMGNLGLFWIYFYRLMANAQ